MCHANPKMPSSRGAQMGNRCMQARKHSRARCAYRIAAAILALALGACTPPPVKPPQVVDAGAEQRSALHSLGFAESDDGWLLNLPEPISFELEHDDLKPNMQQSIAVTAAGLLKANVRRLRIEGHTDNSGPRDYNVALSQRRAVAVGHAFAANGFAQHDITEVGLGPDSPPRPNDTREGRAMNRCVVIIIPVDALAQ
jgi:outer membrane protein OmpA-like peptidoglycan-associated protein